MRIGILKTGSLPPAIAARWGEYPQIFSRFLEQADPGITTFGLDVDGGAPLAAPESADGWLISGSRHGVYDDLPWIEPLKTFLRHAVAAGVPVVGVCFGHQILAEALGGRAVKSDRGWGIGVHQYEPQDVPDWAARLAAPWSGIAIHQDQVVVPPSGARVLMRSEFCPYAALAYGPPDAPVALSVQPHPEYEPELLRALAADRLKLVVPQDRLQQGVESLVQDVDPTPWALTIMDFFRLAAAREHAA
ncbi:MAG: gamma-glutamyl-gamma-aminobutyrate hydrolase family protein [Pseudomonadota bacterium]